MITKFESNIRNIYGLRGQKWLLNLPNYVKDIASKFDLYDLKAVPNLSYNYVLSGFQDNHPIILKFSLDSLGLKKEAHALECFSGFGAVNIIAKEDNMLLLSRAVPGISLKSYFLHKESEAIDIVCNLIKRLQQAKIIEGYYFPNIKDWLSILDKDWEIPLLYLQKARKLRDQLLASSCTDLLLHGDLHHDNILQDHNDWLIIDPKGVIGEIAYEITTFIYNPIPELLMQDDVTDIIQKRITRFSNNLNVSQTRIIKCCFVKIVLSWIWELDDGCDTRYFERMAKIFDMPL